MKETPILFSTPMVQAILEGRKIQTRRVIKFPKDYTGENVWANPPFGLKYTSNLFGDTEESKTVQRISCPYGQPGDVLWVRETAVYVMLEHAHDLLEGATERTQWVYKASIHPDWMEYAKEKYGYKWTPNIHVPKYASRIWLRITDIRVERLQEISEEDAKAEGVSNADTFIGIGVDESMVNRYAFRQLWHFINGYESWEANPWVWVVSFEVISKNGKP